MQQTGPAQDGPSERSLVLAVAAVMVAAQLAFRGWALYPSWFYTDDYRFLHDARADGFDLSYLRAPFDNQFMPVGRALAYLVAHSGNVDWGLTASLVLLLQLLATLACVWMLLTLFGARWGVLAPLGLYLSSAITMPALMWWSASLNQLPLQLVFFVSVATWVRYARSRRTTWLVLTFVALAFGLLCYVKTVLVFAVLAALLLGWFTTGGPRQRVAQALRSYRPALVVAVVLGAAFGLYYIAEVPSIFQSTSWTLTGRLADTMLGDALPSGLVGGPWRWDTSNPPTGYAAAPDWTIHLAWLLLAALALYAWVTRRRTGRVWLLLGGYAVAAFALVLTSRAPVVGERLGLEYRYLTDVVPVAVLCLGLLLLELRGAPGASARRADPLAVALPGPRVLVAVTVVVCVSGIVSSARYARIWHDDNPGATWTHRVIDGLRGRGPVDLAAQPVPEDVVPAFSAPYNTTRLLVPLLVDNARFPDTTDQLVVLADDGRPTKALIATATTSLPGPTPDCGWAVRGGDSVRVPMQGATYDYSWWLRVGYLGSADTDVSVEVAGTRRTVPVQRGPHSLFLQVDGVVDSVTFSGLPEGATVCVDTVEVGQAQPGGDL